MDEVTCPGCGEVFVPGPVRVTESTAVVERFNPAQPRDGDGKWTDGAGPGAAVAAVKNATAAAVPEAAPAGDKLKLHGRIDLGPGERLVSSGKVRSENSDTDLQWAATNGPGGAEARLATVGIGYESDDGTGRWDGAGDETAHLNRRQLRRLRNDLDEAGGEARVLAKAADRKFDAGEDLDARERGDAPVAKGEVRGSSGVVRWEVWLDDQGDYTTSVYTWDESADEGDGAVFFGRGSRRLVKQLDAIDAEMGAAEAADGGQAVGDRVAEADAAGEAVRDRHTGRVLESLAAAPSGQRRFRVQVIAYGDSRNGRRYPQAVMQEAVRLYEGAKAFDRHRSDEELRSGTITGLVGHYSEVAATATGIEATLTLLPSATHAAEVLDAALAQPSNPHAAGISHDVRAHFKPIQVGGRRMAEATQIVDVMSADIVSHPAAGGLALRAVAGGVDPEDLPGAVPGSETEESDVTVTTEGVLAALTTATPEQLASVGLARQAPATDTTTKVVEGEVLVGEVTETWAKGSTFGTIAVEAIARRAELEPRAVEALLPERFSEADIEAAIASAKAFIAADERRHLAPSGTGNVQVTKEARDKQVEALDAMFAGDYTKGYRSFKEAFVDITGQRPRAFDADFNRIIMRETIGEFYDSTARASESGTTGTWAQILGDSITRRMVAEYNRPNLSTWRLIVSSTIPVNDFRTQRIQRLGGYGTLPAVAEGGPYQPLTTPGDEEATYALAKKGGTEDLTIEMIANDDLRAITRIPFKLGLAAAQTLYRFVWDILPTNAAVTYDSTALFHTNHANTQAGALNQTNLSVLRRRMRQQAAYGDSVDILSLLPKYLIVPSALEELAFQHCTSAVAIPATPAGPSDTPNLHQGLKPIVIDYYTDADDWYLVADPSQVPTIEMGFYQGRETPEMFTQADPTVGSMFNADKVTMKIRHIYSGTVLDHRGFQRATN